MKNKNIVYLFVMMLILQSCASKPKIAVDPSSIKDVAKYDTDVEECRAVSLNYDSSDAVAKSAAVGAVGSLATVIAILASGGLYLLPAGAAVAGGTGAAVGGGLASKKQNAAQEKIWAACMVDRGYKAYTSD
tara:strand:- start:596 stop:991 length:396 start_codon:yes stop_codon:yes gene_type:complete